MDPRFGRCAYFVIVDSETYEFEALENPGVQMGSGAGIQAAQFVGNSDAEAIVAGNFGPNSYGALSAAGLAVYQFSGGTVKDGVDAVLSGEAQQISDATVGEKFGMGGGGAGAAPGQGMGGGMGQGPGMGMGRGMGQGRGMGMGQGRGMGMGAGMGPGMAGGQGYGSQPMPPNAPGMQEDYSGYGQPPMPPFGPGMMPPMYGPQGPAFGGPTPEQMAQYHLQMMQMQRNMLDQQIQMMQMQLQWLDEQIQQLQSGLE
jgi:predicted Fe-Mo cluster-binding NifX family protein